MTMQVAFPSELLRPYIRQYWSIEGRIADGQTHLQRIVVTGLPELVCYLQDRPHSSQRIIAGNTVISGQQDGYYDLELTGRVSLFAITFQPHGLHHLLSIPLDEMYNQSVDLEQLDRLVLPDLRERLADSVHFSDRVRLVEKLLAERLIRKTESVDFRRFQTIFQAIKNSHGAASVEKLAEMACLSRKQFERKFPAWMGASPKLFQRIVRFQYSLYLHQTRRFNSFTELAYESGFYDQSHFTNEVKTLTGLSPKRLFSQCEMISDLYGQDTSC